MNQGRIWCVVHPTVGLPLFLASVAITSLVVHASVMTHTTWMGNYWQGKAAKVAENTMPAVAGAETKALAGYSMTVTPVQPANGAAPASFMITLSPAAAPVAAPVETQALDTTAKAPGPVALR